MTSNASDWPVQPRPHDTVWGAWRKALSDTFCTKDSWCILANRPGQLTQSLGSWLHDSSPQTSPCWDTFVQHSSQRLCVPNRLEPGTHRIFTTETRLDFGLATFVAHDASIPIRSEAIPRDAVPAQPTHIGNSHRLNRHNTPPRLGKPTSVPTATSFLDCPRTLPDWREELLAGAFHTSDHDSRPTPPSRRPFISMP